MKFRSHIGSEYRCGWLQNSGLSKVGGWLLQAIKELTEQNNQQEEKMAQILPVWSDIATIKSQLTSGLK